MDKKLSFVLPVYKVEQYLSQCLDSILQQCQPGQTVMARVWRGSQMQDFSLTVEIGG